MTEESAYKAELESKRLANDDQVYLTCKAVNKKAMKQVVSSLRGAEEIKSFNVPWMGESKTLPVDGKVRMILKGAQHHLRILKSSDLYGKFTAEVTDIDGVPVNEGGYKMDEEYQVIMEAVEAENQEAQEEAEKKQERVNERREALKREMKNLDTASGDAVKAKVKKAKDKKAKKAEEDTPVEE